MSSADSCRLEAAPGATSTGRHASRILTDDARGDCMPGCRSILLPLGRNPSYIGCGHRFGTMRAQHAVLNDGFEPFSIPVRRRRPRRVCSSTRSWCRACFKAHILGGGRTRVAAQVVIAIGASINSDVFVIRCPSQRHSRFLHGHSLSRSSQPDDGQYPGGEHIAGTRRSLPGAQPWIEVPASRQKSSRPTGPSPAQASRGHLCAWLLLAQARLWIGGDAQDSAGVLGGEVRRECQPGCAQQD